ncbi:MAG: DJ-1/PfpI family protein [Candidatus Woesearchaeota archaeon]
MKALLIIAQHGFRDEEYFETKEVLEKAGIEVRTVSQSMKECTGKLGGKVMPDLSFSETSVIDYDIVVVIGGPGALALEKIPEFNNIIKSAFDNEQHIAAICIAPMLLAKAGLLEGKKATVFPAPEAIKAFKDFNVHYVKHGKDGVVVDYIGDTAHSAAKDNCIAHSAAKYDGADSKCTSAKIITGNGPEAAKAFGRKIVEVLKGK